MCDYSPVEYQEFPKAPLCTIPVEPLPEGHFATYISPLDSKPGEVQQMIVPLELQVPGGDTVTSFIVPMYYNWSKPDKKWIEYISRPLKNAGIIKSRKELTKAQTYVTLIYVPLPKPPAQMKPVMAPMQRSRCKPARPRRHK